MNFIWKRSFSKITMQECYKGEFSLSLTCSLNDNPRLKFEGM